MNTKKWTAVAMAAMAWVLWRYSTPAGEWVKLMDFQKVALCESETNRIIANHRGHGFRVMAEPSQRIQKAEKVVQEKRRQYMLSHTYQCLPSQIDPRPKK